MVCIYCGTENEEGSAFCIQCGRRIGGEQNAEQSVNTELPANPDYSEVTADDSQTGGIRRKRRMFWIIPAIDISVIVITLLVVFLARRGSGDDGYYSRRGLIKAEYSDDEESGFLPMMDGTIVKIKDATYARLTPDRSQIIYKTDLGKQLYCTDKDLKEKNRITSELDGVEYIDDYIVIYSEDSGYYRYIFSTGQKAKIKNMKTDDYVVSEKNGSILYSSGDSVYRMKGSDDECERLSRIDGYFVPVYISDDGENVYWFDREEDAAEEDDEIEYYSAKVYTYRSDGREKIGSLLTPDNDISCYWTNKDKDYEIISSYGAQELLLIENNQEPVHVKLGGNLYAAPGGFGEIYTSKGVVWDDKNRFSGIYVPVYSQEDKTRNLYYVDANGNKERVVSDITKFDVYDGYLYYTKDDSFIRARLEKSELGETEKISGDVNGFGGMNGYFYLIKDQSRDDTGVLYVSYEGRTPEKVTGEFFSTYLDVSLDGKTIYFFKDYDDDDGTAVLYRYRYHDDNPEKISEDVICGSVTSGYKNGWIIDDDAVEFKKSQSKNSYDLMYYDGTQTIPLIKDLEK